MKMLLLSLLFVFFNVSMSNCRLFGQENICKKQMSIYIKDGSDYSKLGFSTISLYMLNRSIQIDNSDVDGFFFFNPDSVPYLEISYATYYPIILKTSNLKRMNVVYMITCDELLKTGYVKHDKNMKKLDEMIIKFSDNWMKNKKNMDKDFRKIDDFYNNRIAKPIAK